MPRKPRAKVQPPPECRPAGDLTAWPQELYRCAGPDCDATVRHVRAGPTLNDWATADLDGRTWRDDRPQLLRDDPATWWQQLADAMLAGDDRAGNLYSILSGLGDWAGMRTWTHHHQTGERLAARPDRDPPFCCTKPMWASPDGWKCRVTGQLFAYT